MTRSPARKPRGRPTQGPSGAWSLWIAIPLDVAGLYFVLGGLHLIPESWPTPNTPDWILIAGAVALFAVARAIALFTVRRLLRLRIASDAWSRLVSRGPHTR